MTTTLSQGTIQQAPLLLFIDDEPTILTALRDVFRSGYEVTVATDGREAVEMLRLKNFHVVISDQRMPTVTGIEVLRQAQEISPNTVRILLTGYSDPDAVLSAINDVEVHRFLQKPWDNAKLRRTVDEAVQLAMQLSSAATNDKVEMLNNAFSPSATSSTECRDEVEQVQSQPQPNIEKEVLLVVDSKAAIYSQIKIEMSGRLEVLHAPRLLEVFHLLGTRSISTIVYSFDVQNEADRMFVQMMKQEYPNILVIAVCDSTDSTHLIELINQAKIFRFIKRPVSMPILSRYIMSAIAQVDRMKKNPVLIGQQQAETLSDAAAKSVSVSLFKDHFSRVNLSIAARFSKLFSRS